MADASKWFIEADYLQACNCDYGCPCEFEAPPTMGFCEGMSAWKITSGAFGDVSLNGLGLCLALKFPGAMHKGGGTGLWFVDEKADARQREALVKIATGKAGGMPFEILAMIFTKFLPPVYAPFSFDLKGRDSSVKVGNALSIQLEPIRNPVSGEPEQIRIEHGTGFVFKAADCASAKEGMVNSPGMAFSYPNKAGFVTRIRYGN